jgi:hypothetical protein
MHILHQVTPLEQGIPSGYFGNSRLLGCYPTLTTLALVPWKKLMFVEHVVLFGYQHVH